MSAERLTDERLLQLRDDEYVCANENERSMAAELLELRWRVSQQDLTLSRVADELGCERTQLDLWFAQRVVAVRDNALDHARRLAAQLDRVTEEQHTTAHGEVTS